MPPNICEAVSATREGQFIPSEEAFILVKFEDSTKSFRKLSPYKIRDGLNSVLPSAPSQITALRSGSLLIKTCNAEQTEALLGWSSFRGERVKTFPADKLNQVEGFVYAPELTSETPQTILDESFWQGVTKVTRLPSKSSRPNPLLKIMFSSTELPVHFYAVYMRYDVRPCYQLPRRCPKCQRYDHGRASCQSKVRCKRCAGEHPFEGCTAPPRCAACEGPHQVTDKNCPAWKAKLQKLREAASMDSGGRSTSSSARQVTNRANPSRGYAPWQVPSSPLSQDPSAGIPSNVDPHEWPELSGLRGDTPVISRNSTPKQRHKSSLSPRPERSSPQLLTPRSSQLLTSPARVTPAEEGPSTSCDAPTDIPQSSTCEQSGQKANSPSTALPPPQQTPFPSPQLVTSPARATPAEVGPSTSCDAPTDILQNSTREQSDQTANSPSTTLPPPQQTPLPSPQLLTAPAGTAHVNEKGEVLTDVVDSLTENMTGPEQSSGSGKPETSPPLTPSNSDVSTNISDSPPSDSDFTETKPVANRRRCSQRLLKYNARPRNVGYRSQPVPKRAFIPGN